MTDLPLDSTILPPPTREALQLEKAKKGALATQMLHAGLHPPKPPEEPKFELPKRVKRTSAKEFVKDYSHTVKNKDLKKEVERLAKDYKPNKANIIDAKALRLSSSEMAEIARDKPVIWSPNPGPQTEFLASDEMEVLFSGGRGSGKSDPLIIDPLRFCNNKNFRALVIRRTMPELKELIGRAKDLYYKLFPGVKWKEQDKSFTFPSGATVEFGYCDAVDDAERYRGQQYTWLGIDELSQYDSPEILNKLKASLRTTDKKIKIYCRYTTNPSGKGRWWVKEMFVDRAEPGVTFFDEFNTKLGKMRISKKWIQSTVMDNPHLLDNNPQYLATLNSLAPTLRKQWLEGSWDAVEGMAFPDFEATTHVIKPFVIPSGWMRFRGCDWGYASFAVTIWLAADHDHNLYVYREFVANGSIEKGKPRLNAGPYSQRVVDMEKGEVIKYGVLDSSTWAARGDSGPSIAEEMMVPGSLWRPSDRSPGSRKAGVMRMHELLRPDELTNRPKIFIFDTCKELIKCIQSLPVDENDPEDVDTDANDHAWDALRYAIMSRPYIANDPWLIKSFNDKPVIIDNVFGY